MTRAELLDELVARAERVLTPAAVRTSAEGVLGLALGGRRERTETEAASDLVRGLTRIFSPTTVPQTLGTLRSRADELGVKELRALLAELAGAGFGPSSSTSGALARWIDASGLPRFSAILARHGVKWMGPEPASRRSA